MKIDYMEVECEVYGKTIQDLLNDIKQTYDSSVNGINNIECVEIKSIQNDYSEDYSTKLVITYKREETEAEKEQDELIKKRRLAWKRAQYEALKKEFE